MVTGAKRLHWKKPMNAHAARMPDLIETVYGCIADSGQWQSALDTICTLFSGCMGTLAVVDTAHNHARFSVLTGEPGLVAPLVANYASGMPFFPALPHLDVDVPVTVDTVYDVQGPDARQCWLSSPMAQNWAIPNRLDDFFWLPVLKQPSRVGNLVVVTHKDRHQITKEEMRQFALMAPHVRRAVTIGDLFETERRKAAIFAEILDALAHPVLVVSDDMEVLYANAAGEAALRDKSAVSTLRGKLAMTWPAANNAVRLAVSEGHRDEFALGASGIGVPLARSACPSVAHVLPLSRRDPSARVSQRAAAAIFIAEAGSAPLPAMDAIGALFGLTPAEKRVAAQVAEGRTRQEIAETSGVSDGTVKSQLASIFGKSGASDQRSLELMIRELTPPVRKN